MSGGVLPLMWREKKNKRLPDKQTNYETNEHTYEHHAAFLYSVTVIYQKTTRRKSSRGAGIMNNYDKPRHFLSSEGNSNLKINRKQVNGNKMRAD